MPGAGRALHVARRAEGACCLISRTASCHHAAGYFWHAEATSPPAADASLVLGKLLQSFCKHAYDFVLHPAPVWGTSAASCSKSDCRELREFACAVSAQLSVPLCLTLRRPSGSGDRRVGLATVNLRLAPYRTSSLALNLIQLSLESCLQPASMHVCVHAFSADGRLRWHWRTPHPC